MYWCEVVLLTSDRASLLKGYPARTPRLAVRWNREQALQAADWMDHQASSPRRQQESFPWDVLSPIALSCRPYISQALRKWWQDTQRHEWEMWRLGEGDLITITASGWTAALAISARPISVWFGDDWHDLPLTHTAA